MLEYQDHLHQHLAPWRGLFLTLFQPYQTVTNQGLKPQSALWLQLRLKQAHCGFDRLISAGLLSGLLDHNPEILLIRLDGRVTGVWAATATLSSSGMFVGAAGINFARAAACFVIGNG